MQFFIAKIKMCQKDIMFIPTPQSWVFTIGDVIHLHSQRLSSNTLMRLRQFDIYFDCDFNCMPSWYPLPLSYPCSLDIHIYMLTSFSVFKMKSHVYLKVILEQTYPNVVKIFCSLFLIEFWFYFFWKRVRYPKNEMCN